MSDRVYAQVTPALLTWAREAAGYPAVEDAAPRVGVKPDVLAAWEAGAKQPSFRQLMVLATAYRRPLSLFFLQRPPEDTGSLPDFRRLPEAPRLVGEPQLLYQVRMARERREVALELLGGLGEAAPTFDLSATIDEDPERVAERLRRRLGVSLDDQFAWNMARAYSRWRSAVEASGTLVFSCSDIPVEVMRGFCIAERPLPVVAVNSKDLAAGRTFSLLHEFVHAVLGVSNVSDLDLRGPSGYATRVEIFCNHVAGSVLVPAQALLEEPAVQTFGARAEFRESWDQDTLGALALRFCVSEEVILRRLLILGRTTEEFYRRMHQFYRSRYASDRERLTDKQRDSPGGPSWVRTVVSRTGRKFSGIVLSALDADVIGVEKLQDYLGLRPRFLPVLRKEVATGS